jgi:ribosomal protein S27AE
MTVRVIKKKPNKSVVKRKVCDNCGVTLEYTPQDIHRRDGTDYGGGPDGEEWIVCPECGKKVILKSW